MRLKFFASNKQREQQLGLAFAAGANREKGVKATVHDLCATPDISGADAVAMVGVKSRRLFQACLEAGVVPIIHDKGYIRTRRVDSRTWEYWRVAVGAHHPTELLAKMNMPSDRAVSAGFHDFKPWRSSGLQILIAGSSAKYHEFYGLPDPTEWARGVIEELRQHTTRPIIYRPKPSWDGAVPIEGSFFSGPKENVLNAIRNSWAVVTHGSNTCFEAALEGIPSIVLGNGVAAPISSHSLSEIENPARAKREKWFNNLAYCQWTEPEMSAGLAWPHIRGWIDEFQTKQGV